MKYKEANIPEGLRLVVEHRRGPQWSTVARLYAGDELVATGISICNPKDNPSRKVGRAIAVGRALKQLHERVGIPPRSH